jgi:hypothetical protein
MWSNGSMIVVEFLRAKISASPTATTATMIIIVRIVNRNLQAATGKVRSRNWGDAIALSWPTVVETVDTRSPLPHSNGRRPSSVRIIY